MKKQSQDLTNEQLHIEDAAAVQEEYSLEDIMNEFGGWSKRSEPEAPPLDTAQASLEQKAEQRTPAEEANASDTKIVRFPAQAKRFPEEKEEKPPKNPADFTGQTIRFTPIREEQTQQAEKPKIWTYQAEPDPEPAPPSDPKEAKKAARRAQRAQIKQGNIGAFASNRGIGFAIVQHLLINQHNAYADENQNQGHQITIAGVQSLQSTEELCGQHMVAHWRT